jgi:hypothetical protein
MNEDRLAEQIGQAQRASALLNDEAFIKAVAAVHQDLMDRWELSKDPAERERIWVSVDLLKKITIALHATVSGGTVARGNLDDIVSGRTRKQFGIV